MFESEIEILTEIEINRLKDYWQNNNPILGFYDSNLDLIKLGEIKSHKVLIETLTHEYIHKTLTFLLNRDISHKFDLFIYKNLETTKKAHKLGLI